VLLAVERAVYALKAHQTTVFAAWCLVYGNGSLAPAHPGPIVLGGAAALVVVGQILVIATFYRLGRTGVFFGDRFGYEVRHCREFPFSLLSHPQYVGTMLTIWGVLSGAPIPARRLVRAAGRRDRVLRGGDLARVAAPIGSGLAEENRADVGLGARPSIVRVDRD